MVARPRGVINTGLQRTLSGVLRGNSKSLISPMSDVRDGQLSLPHGPFVMCDWSELTAVTFRDSTWVVRKLQTIASACSEESVLRT